MPECTAKLKKDVDVDAVVIGVIFIVVIVIVDVVAVVIGVIFIVVIVIVDVAVVDVVVLRWLDQYGLEFESRIRCHKKNSSV